MYACISGPQGWLDFMLFPYAHGCVGTYTLWYTRTYFCIFFVCSWMHRNNHALTYAHIPPTRAGELHFNGHQISRRILPRIAGYVPQTDQHAPSESFSKYMYDNKRMCIYVRMHVCMYVLTICSFSGRFRLLPRNHRYDPGVHICHAVLEQKSWIV